MRIFKRSLLLASAIALPLGLVTMMGATSASAKGGTFSGDAVGKVTCTGVTVKISFSPPAMATTGATSVSIAGKVSSCTVSNLPAGVTETITQGKIIGSATGSGTGCSGVASGSNN